MGSKRERGGEMLPQTFFDGDTVEIARALVGKYLVRQYDGITLAARVTETEAYIGRRATPITTGKQSGPAPSTPRRERLMYT